MITREQVAFPLMLLIAATLFYRVVRRATQGAEVRAREEWDRAIDHGYER